MPTAGGRALFGARWRRLGRGALLSSVQGQRVQWLMHRGGRSAGGQLCQQCNIWRARGGNRRHQPDSDGLLLSRRCGGEGGACAYAAVGTGASLEPSSVWGGCMGWSLRSRPLRSLQCGMLFDEPGGRHRLVARSHRGYLFRRGLVLDLGLSAEVFIWTLRGGANSLYSGLWGLQARYPPLNSGRSAVWG